MFQGFPEETIRFFLDLRFHNEVPWFHAHREEYENFIRTPFREFIEAMTPRCFRFPMILNCGPAGQSPASTGIFALPEINPPIGITCGFCFAGPTRNGKAA